MNNRKKFLFNKDKNYFNFLQKDILLHYFEISRNKEHDEVSASGAVLFVIVHDVTSLYFLPTVGVGVVLRPSTLWLAHMKTCVSRLHPMHPGNMFVRSLQWSL